jgi:hypothetical protein
MLRVSKDPNDKAFSRTADQRRVWCNDREIHNWVSADEFRRSVVTKDGKALNGSVRIERLPEDSPQPIAVPESIVAAMPIDCGFASAGMVPEPKSMVAETVEMVEVASPGVPDEVVVDTPSERLPDDEPQE